MILRPADSEAVRLMVERNRPLVRLILSGVNSWGMDRDDLFAWGDYYLIEAATRYDEARGYKFTTFAASWIRWSIRKRLLAEAGLIRVPPRQDRSLFTPAHFTDLTIRGLDGLDYERPLPAFYTTPFDSLAQSRKMVATLIAQLRENERFVIVHRFGLDGEGERNLQTIGEDLGVSRERVRQLEARALARMRLVIRIRRGMARRRRMAARLLGSAVVRQFVAAEPNFSALRLMPP